MHTLEIGKKRPRIWGWKSINQLKWLVKASTESNVPLSIYIYIYIWWIPYHLPPILIKERIESQVRNPPVTTDPNPIQSCSIQYIVLSCCVCVCVFAHLASFFRQRRFHKYIHWYSNNMGSMSHAKVTELEYLPLKAINIRGMKWTRLSPLSLSNSCLW